MYENPESPCERCKERGVTCGPKIWGERAEKILLEQRPNEVQATTAVLFLGRRLPKPDDPLVTPLDEHYWQYFLFENSKGTYNLRGLIERDHLPIYMTPNTLMPRLVASNTFRYAACAFASSILRAESSALHTSLYLDRCYKQLRKALSGPLSIDLGYAVYLLAHLSTPCGDPIPHLAALSEIVPRLRDHDAVDWLAGKYKEVLDLFRCRICDSWMEVGRITEQVGRVYEILRSTWRSLPDHVEFLSTVYFYYSTYALLLLNGFGEQLPVRRDTMNYQ